MLISAAGITAPPVFVIADERMAEGEFKVYTIVGLGLTTEVAGCDIYVMYCKTRCGNVGFYRWLIESILVLWVQEIRRKYNLPFDCIAWFQLDGEPVQLICFADPELQLLLKLHNIAVGKPAS